LRGKKWKKDFFLQKEGERGGPTNYEGAKKGRGICRKSESHTTIRGKPWGKEGLEERGDRAAGRWPPLRGFRNLRRRAPSYLQETSMLVAALFRENIRRFLVGGKRDDSTTFQERGKWYQPIKKGEVATVALLGAGRSF